VNEYLNNDQYLLSIKQINMNLDIVCSYLNKIDKLFPSNDLWIDYYNIKTLSEIIKISGKKKKFNGVL
jgi:hypothetical protein